MVLLFFFEIDGVVIGQPGFLPADELVGGGTCSLEELSQQPTDRVRAIGHTELRESPRALCTDFFGKLSKMTARYMQAEVSVGIVDVKLYRQGLIPMLDLGDGQVDPCCLKPRHLGKEMRASGDAFASDMNILQEPDAHPPACMYAQVLVDHGRDQSGLPLHSECVKSATALGIRWLGTTTHRQRSERRIKGRIERFTTIGYRSCFGT